MSISFTTSFCSSDDSSSDVEELVVDALVVHGHISRKRPQFRGSILGHAPALTAIGRGATPFSMSITLRIAHSSNHTNFVAGS